MAWFNVEFRLCFSGPVSNDDLFNSLIDDSPLKPAPKPAKSRDTYKFEPSVDSLEGSDDEYNPSTSKKAGKGELEIQYNGPVTLK